MAYCYALTASPLPHALHGVDADHSIRVISDTERLAIEDQLFSKGIKRELRPGATAVIVPQEQIPKLSLEDFAVLTEFALGVLTISGFAPVAAAATLNGTVCSAVLERPTPEAVEAPTFPKKLVKAAASTWVHHLFSARRETKNGLHITADRFVRYLKMSESRDALVDLCICLESLIEAQTEISFRFATCLAKVSGQKNIEEVSELLAALYDMRSKVVHGADSTKEHHKLQPKTPELRLVARAILTSYVLYLTEHTKKEWKTHLKSSLFR